MQWILYIKLCNTLYCSHKNDDPSSMTPFAWKNTSLSSCVNISVNAWSQNRRIDRNFPLCVKSLFLCRYRPNNQYNTGNVFNRYSISYINGSIELKRFGIHFCSLPLSTRTMWVLKYFLHLVFFVRQNDSAFQKNLLSIGRRKTTSSKFSHGLRFANHDGDSSIR